MVPPGYSGNANRNQSFSSRTKGMLIKIREWLVQPQVWRYVCLASFVVAIICFARSSSFTILFGKWRWGIILIYVALNFAISLLILLPSLPLSSTKHWLKALLAFWVLMVTTVYSYYLDKKGVNQNLDVYSLISTAAFCITSLSWSRMTYWGIEVDFLYFFCGNLTLQLMAKKFWLIIVGASYSCCLIHLRPFLDDQRQQQGGEEVGEGEDVEVGEEVGEGEDVEVGEEVGEEVGVEVELGEEVGEGQEEDYIYCDDICEDDFTFYADEIYIYLALSEDCTYKGRGGEEEEEEEEEVEDECADDADSYADDQIWEHYCMGCGLYEIFDDDCADEGGGGGEEEGNSTDTGLSMGGLMICIETLENEKPNLISKVSQHALQHLQANADPDVNLVRDTLPLRFINDLHAVVKPMVEGGAESERRCCDVYSSWRRQFLEDCLFRCGLQEINNETWINVCTVAVRILFPNEKTLCDRVFRGFSSAADISFTETCRDLTLRLLNFLDTLPSETVSPRLVVDCKQASQDLFPSLQSLFSSSEALRNEVRMAGMRLRDVIRSILMNLERLISQDMATVDGGIHPITPQVMNHLCSFKDSQQR